MSAHLSTVQAIPLLHRLQLEQYIKRHLAYAGAEHDIFSDNAVGRYPSFRVEQLECPTRSASMLLYGAQNSRMIIDVHMLRSVVQGALNLFSLSPLEHLPYGQQITV